MEEAAALIGGSICVLVGLALPIVALVFALVARSNVARLERRVSSLSLNLQEARETIDGLRQQVAELSWRAGARAPPAEVVAPSAAVAPEEGPPTLVDGAPPPEEESRPAPPAREEPPEPAAEPEPAEVAPAAPAEVAPPGTEPASAETEPAAALGTAESEAARAEPFEPAYEQPSAAAGTGEAGAEPFGPAHEEPPGPAPSEADEEPTVVEPGPDGPPATLEQRLALTWLSRIGAVALLLGVAYGYKYAVDNDWIGPWARVGLGVAAGLGVLAAATWLRMHRIFRQVLLGVGVAILSLAAYATYGFYELVPVTVAFLAVAVVSLFGGALAYSQRSQPILILALATGLANPVLLSSGRDQALGLFAYLLVLTGVAIFASIRLRFAWPIWIAVVGTMVLFGGWYERFFDISPVEADLRPEVLAGEAAPRAGAYLEWTARVVPLAFVLLFGGLWIGSRFYAKLADLDRTHLRVLSLVGLAAAQLGGIVLLPDAPVALGIWLSVLAALTVPLLIRSELSPALMALPMALAFIGLLVALLRGDGASAFLGATITVIWVGATLSGLVRLALSASPQAASSRWVVLAILPLFAVLFGAALLQEHPHAYGLGLTVAAALYLAFGLRLRWDLSHLITIVVTALALIAAAGGADRPAVGMLAISALWALISLAGLTWSIIRERDVEPPLRLISLTLPAVAFVCLVIVLTGGTTPTLRSMVICGLAVALFAAGAALLRLLEGGAARLAPHLILGECLASCALALGLLFSGIEFSVAFLALGTITVAIAAQTERLGWLGAAFVLLAIGLIHVLGHDVAQPYLEAIRFRETLGREGALHPAVVTNVRAYGLLALAAAALVSAWILQRRGLGPAPALARVAAAVCASLGHLALLSGVVIEVRNAVRPWPPPPPPGLDEWELSAFLDLVRQVQAPAAAAIELSTTLAFGLYGVLAVAGGFIFRSAFHRYLGLSILLITVGKLAMWDIWNLTRGYQVVVLLSVGVLLLGSGFLYARFGSRLVALIRDGASGAAGLILLLLVTSLAIPGVARAEPMDTARFRSMRAIEGVEAEGLHRAVVDVALYHAAGHPLGTDLRIAGPGGEEVPFLIRQISPPYPWQEPRMYDSGLLAEGGSRAVFDLGPERHRHSAIDLELEGFDFLRRVQIETSDDGSSYTIVRRGPVVFSVGRNLAHHRVDYPPSQARFVRVTILDGDGRAPRIAGARVTLLELEDEARYGTIPLGITSRDQVPDQGGEGRSRTELVLDAGGRGVPLTSLRFDVGPGAFERRVSVAATNYDQVWPSLASGWIYRAADALGGEHLEVDLPPTRKRFFKVSIHNLNDQPIPITSITGVYIRDELIFSASRAGGHLLYLSPREPIGRPAYDLARVLERTGQAPLAEARLGQIVDNPRFREGPPRPRAWSERFRLPISIVLAVVVVVLAGLTVFLLRRGPSAPPRSERDGGR